MHSRELQWVQEARDTFLATKADFFKRFEEAPDLTDDLIGLRETTFKNFDHLIEIVLCKIASADGPINATERLPIWRAFLPCERRKIFLFPM